VQVFPRTSLSGYALFLRLFEVADALNDVVQTLGARWSAAAGDDAKARFQRAPVKTPKRAIEKIWRSYNGQPDHLADIVRTSIVCGEVAEIHAVMQAIVADDTVEIVRIKNRFAPHHDATLTAGYRDLALNLKLTPQPTQPAHAEAIFEVQVQHRDIYSIKSVEGHAKYAKYRDLRAV
jgi:ppGpp synthetase/RelA/SpoT-type nucleotidyltranferase